MPPPRGSGATGTSCWSGTANWPVVDPVGPGWPPLPPRSDEGKRPGYRSRRFDLWAATWPVTDHEFYHIDHVEHPLWRGVDNPSHHVELQKLSAEYTCGTGSKAWTLGLARAYSRLSAAYGPNPHPFPGGPACDFHRQRPNGDNQDGPGGSLH